MADKDDRDPVNLDEIEPETLGAPETGDEAPECPDSPSGNHEFDLNEETNAEACVYCGQEKGE